MIWFRQIAQLSTTISVQKLRHTSLNLSLPNLWSSNRFLIYFQQFIDQWIFFNKLKFIIWFSSVKKSKHRQVQLYKDDNKESHKPCENWWQIVNLVNLQVAIFIQNMMLMLRLFLQGSYLFNPLSKIIKFILQPSRTSDCSIHNIRWGRGREVTEVKKKASL